MSSVFAFVLSYLMKGGSTIYTSTVPRPNQCVCCFQLSPPAKVIFSFFLFMVFLRIGFFCHLPVHIGWVCRRRVFGCWCWWQVTHEMWHVKQIFLSYIFLDLKKNIVGTIHTHWVVSSMQDFADFLKGASAASGTRRNKFWFCNCFWKANLQILLYSSLQIQVGLIHKNRG